MTLSLILVLAASGAQVTAAPEVQTLVNATKFDLVFSGSRVSGCTVTATSGNPKVDQFICDSARSCGDQFGDTDRQAACVAEKRLSLADRVTKNPKWLKW